MLNWCGIRCVVSCKSLNRILDPMVLPYRFVFVLMFWSAASTFAAATPGRAKAQEQSTTFAVYFHNTGLSANAEICDRVFPLVRTVPATHAVAREALNSLFAGPSLAEQKQGYHSPFNYRTEGILKNIRIVRQTAYVDLHDIRPVLPGTSSSCGSAEFFAEVQSTLRQFPSVRRIVFAIDGKPREFYDWMQAECDRSNNHCDPRPFVLPHSKKRKSLKSRPPNKIREVQPK